MIALKNVSFAYENARAGEGLHDICLTVRAGEAVLLCGESGCGKTTLTRLINGLIPHYHPGILSGQVLVSGKDVSTLPMHETAQLVGSVFQNPKSQFFNVDSTSELAFALENMGMPPEEIRERVYETARALRLTDLLDRSVFKLSGGQKQKLACGAVAALEPPVFVLDEPSSNLDSASIRDLRRMLALWKEQGRTIIVAEHRLHYLRGIVDRVLFMRQGWIEREYSAGEFFALRSEVREAMGLRAPSLEGLQASARQTIPLGGEIELSKFYFCYPRCPLALDMSRLNIPKGAVIAVIGRNGAGKSTFARCLSGLEKKCPGAMRHGERVMDARARLKACYMVMQDTGRQLFTESVLDEVLLSMEEEDAAKAESILSSLDLLPLKELHPMSLSGGQKQRVAIATAVASKRDVILLDEPTSGLDFRHMQGVAAIISRLASEGRTLLVITHDPEMILACCTHALHMEEGRAKALYPLDPEGVRRMLSFFLAAEGGECERAV